MTEAVQELDLLDSIRLLDLPVPLVCDENFAKADSQKYVAFYLGDLLFGIPADEVAEVVHPFRITLLPNMPRNLVGITAVRGEVVAVLDLRQAAGLPPAAPGSKEKLVILSSTRITTQLSFPADKMHEIVLLAETEIAASRGRTPDFVSGVARLASGELKIIDVRRLPDLLTLG